MRLHPPGSSERYVEIEGGRVRILTSSGSTGPALLLLHGGGSDNAAISWYELYVTLGAEHPMYALDLPGFGETEGIAPHGSPASTADFVARVCSQLGLEQVVVVGVSMGGDIALNLALRRPRLVAGLVLIAPGGLVPVLRNRVTQLAAWLAAQLPDPVLFLLTGLANTYVDAALSGMVSDVGKLPPPVRTEFARQARRPGGALGYLRYNQATLGRTAMRNNLLPVVGRIAAPTLFFHGADDPLVPPAGSAAAVAAIPNARLVLVPDCGHWAQLEAPDRFLIEVRAFLAAIPG